MSHPHYGDYTVARICRANVPDPQPGWVAATCPYCGQGCWERPEIESQANLLGSFTFACTNCALKRHHHQAEMDAARYARECEQATE